MLYSLAASCFVFPAAAKPFDLSANASPSTSWVVADLNGDRIADFAATGPGQRDGAGYVHRISIQLTGFRATSFVVRGSSPSVRLSFRDIDGDHDRDLIVLESWSASPVGVWLNDGTGHFTEANVSDYAARLGNSGSRAFDTSRSATEPAASLHDERSPSASFTVSSATESDCSEFAAANHGAASNSILDGAFSPRGPPLCI
jgi:hypothetical protein